MAESTIAETFLMILCLPIIIINLTVSNCKARRKQLARWPQPLSRSKHHESIVNNHGQSLQDSKFFSLPMELRLIIYDYVLGHDTVHHITCRTLEASNRDENTFKHQLESYACPNPFAFGNNPMCSCVAWGLTVYDVLHYTKRKRPEWADRGPGRDVKSLTMTCRELYFDVLNFSFKYHTFRYDNPETIVLSSMTQPYFFNNICSLYLNTQIVFTDRIDLTVTIRDFPSSYRKRFSHLSPPRESMFKNSFPGIWSCVCDAISGIPTLKRLRMNLCQNGFKAVLYAKGAEKTYNEAFVFEPLQKIGRKRQLELFEVEFDWAEEKEKKSEEEEKTSFVLTRNIRKLGGHRFLECPQCHDFLEVLDP